MYQNLGARVVKTKKTEQPKKRDKMRFLTSLVLGKGSLVYMNGSKAISLYFMKCIEQQKWHYWGVARSFQNQEHTVEKS